MSKKMDKILAEISAGELFDKITILEIKKAKISNKEKLNDIERELSSLKETVKKFIPDQSNISKYIDDLKNINLRLWDIEDGKRAAEKNKDFGNKFIELARNVYKFNDERAKIKLAINTSLGSNIKEVKSYE
jgi:predicted nuclease with TOPRIM domain